MRRHPSTTIAVTAAAFLVTGGLAFAAVSSVADSPAPQVVVPSSSSLDDPATHDAGDDHGGTRARTGSDDPATHDVGDDHGGTRTGTDDPATHDLGDDHGGSLTSTPAPTATVDDHGGGSGSSGSGSSGSGSGGSGSDDGGGHGSDG